MKNILVLFCTVLVLASDIYPQITQTPSIFGLSIGSYTVKRPGDLEELYKNGRGISFSAAKQGKNKNLWAGVFFEYVNVPLDEAVFFRNSGVIGGRLDGGGRNYVSANLFLKFRLFSVAQISPYFSAALGRVFENQEETTLYIGNFRSGSDGGEDGYFSSHVTLGSDFEFAHPFYLFVEFSVLTYYRETSYIQFIPVKAGLRFTI
ncbi:MAG: hypothetical protein IT279_01780 [Ignavibacteriaceae bacterium]|nr:hypothetical protein [Ignavibacteriaceae bacterium]